MRIIFRCGCGGINTNLEDWICHFKYRTINKSIWKAVKNFLFTRVEFY